MKTLFKLLLTLFITAQVSFSQNFSKIEMDEIHTIYDESFTTNANTTLVLNISNSAARIYKSKDDKVHVKYTMEFKNYRKKVIEANLKGVSVSGKKERNKITYTSKSKNSRYYRKYQLEEILIGRLGRGINDTAKVEQSVVKKSLDSVLRQINLSDSDRFRSLLGISKIKPRVKKWKKSDKIHITKMDIYIPENIHVRATFENSSLVFSDKFVNQATINSRNSNLKFKYLGNPLNVFDVDNGSFRAEHLDRGSYSFANTKEVTIGSVKNTLINSEFTKIELGEIQKGVIITDFNSEYWFYNWAKDFEHFNLHSEYSKIHFFYPELDHSLKVFGNNTKNFVGKHEIVMQPTNKGEKYLMMERKVKGDKEFSGHIYFDIIHAIIYSHNDSIISINK